MLRISRTNIGPIGLWWYTVDRWMLFGLILLGLIGLFFSLAVSPAEAISIKTDPYFFLTRHLIYCFISLFFSNFSNRGTILNISPTLAP